MESKVNESKESDDQSSIDSLNPETSSEENHSDSLESETTSSSSSYYTSEDSIDEQTNLDEMFSRLTLDSVVHTNKLEDIVKNIKNGQIKNIITMVGAGISTAAGIPDFRSPDIGLYHNLAKYNLPYPQAIFEITRFKRMPQPFFILAQELFPGKFQPTKTHYFIKLLNEKKLLLRHYTQNIDNLERMAGIPEDKLIEAHGTFCTSHCLKCKQKYSLESLKEKIAQTKIPFCDKCKSLIKPDIVFFGESLPIRFFQNFEDDFEMCDLLIVMGSSLTVEPFASLVEHANKTCPRLIINEKRVGQSNGIKYSKKSRDIFIKGKCDVACQKLVEMLEWDADYEETLKHRDTTAT